MQKVDLCISTSNGPQTYKSILSVFSQAFSDFVDFKIISDTSQARSDCLLFYHNSYNGKWECKNKLGLHFLHDTMTMHMRESFFGENSIQKKYVPVANCGLMRDLFYERRLSSFPNMDKKVEVCKNYPDWSMANCKNSTKSGYLWLTRISSVEKIKVYANFIDFCKKNNIVPTVVSAVEPPYLNQDIDWIRFIDYNCIGAFVSQFEYGFGIGRSALDMSVCGLKVIVCGHKISDGIDESTIEKHMYSNFNSHATETTRTIKELVETATASKDLVLSIMTKDSMISEIEEICNKYGTSLKGG